MMHGRSVAAKRSGAAPPPAPTYVSVNPSSGSTAGGTLITVTGTGFRNDIVIKVDGVALSTTFVNSTTATAVTSAHGAATVNITVQQSSGSATGTNVYTFSAGANPFLFEDFSTYSSIANCISDPRGIYVLSDDVLTSQMALDTGTGISPSTQSLRFDYPSQPGNCADYTITRSLAFPADKDEIWWGIRYKFSSTWTNINAGHGCGSNPDYKFTFVGVRSQVGHRYNVMVGTNVNVNYTVGYPGNEDGFEGGSASGNFDGNWHYMQGHYKNAVAGTCAVAVDGSVVKNYGVVDTSVGLSMYKLTYARNINQGPPAAQSMWLGQIAIYDTNPGGWPV